MFPIALIISLTVSSVISLLLAVTLFNLKENQRAYRFFGALFLISLLFDWTMPFRYLGGVETALWCFRVQELGALICSCLLDISVLYLVGPPGTRVWIHLIPPVGLGFIYLSFILFFEKTRIDEFSFGLACVLVSTAISLIWTNQNIRYFQSWLKHNYANPNCIKLGWLRVIFFVTAAIWMLRFFDALTGPGVPLWHFRPMLRAIGLCWVAYYLIKYSLVFQEVRGLAEERKEKSPPVSPEDLVRLSDKLKQLFEKEKPYLDPEFRLSDLAKLLSLKPYQASYFLNQSLQESFYDLVNRARIEEVKRRLKDPKYQHLNILGVGFDCGFNSKSSFVEAFKKWTHQTPSEYRRSNV